MERLHKYLAHCGIASRRKAEEMIAEGRVAVNGKPVTEMGVKIDPAHDRVTVDNKTVGQEAPVYYLLHKPVGYASTVSDEQGRRTVLDLLKDVKERVYPVGRLDLDSEGLLVLTNDGDLTYHLTHPSHGVLKTYHATITGEIEEAAIKRLTEKGIRLGAMKIQPVRAKIIRVGKVRSVVEVTVGEGVNREIRRVFAALGHEVKRLVRIRIGSLLLKGITRGKYRRLRKNELDKLRKNMERATSEEGVEAINARQRTRYYGKREERMGKPDPARNIRGKRTRVNLPVEEVAADLPTLAAADGKQISSRKNSANKSRSKKGVRTQRDGTSKKDRRPKSNNRSAPQGTTAKSKRNATKKNAQKNSPQASRKVACKKTAKNPQKSLPKTGRAHPLKAKKK